MTIREGKSQYINPPVTIDEAAEHLLHILESMANRLHNATCPASVGDQKADAQILIDESQPLEVALKRKHKK